MENTKHQVTQLAATASGKRSYERPRLSRFGQLADITRSAALKVGSNDGFAEKTN